MLASQVRQYISIAAAPSNTLNAGIVHPSFTHRVLAGWSMRPRRCPSQTLRPRRCSFRPPRVSPYATVELLVEPRDEG
jgi:hypothetical protein